MTKYIHVSTNNIDSTIRALTQNMSSNGIFYNIAVLPYRGRKLDPKQYVTIKIG